jgi:hypothetical protein
MTDPILARVTDPIARGIEALVRARPSAAPHIDGGRYGHLFAGWRAQEALVLAALADRVASMRLGTATGDDLRELAASEFDALIDASRTTAIGTMRLARTGARPAGVIRNGSLFRRAANPAATPPYADALYQATADVYVPGGAAIADVPVEATQSGAGANVLAPSTPTFEVASSLFDSAWRVANGEAAGGSDGVTDVDVRRIARAVAIGRNGPVANAVIAGAMLATGARHAAVIEDSARAVTRLLLADASWTSSTAWRARIQQLLYDGYVGFGCRVAVESVPNSFVKVSARLVLRNASLLSDTSEIATNAASALRRYFDERPDWYTYRLGALRAVLARCDPRVLTCDDATVESMWSQFAMPIHGDGPTYTHVFLVDNALSIDFRAPR